MRRILSVMLMVVLTVGLCVAAWQRDFGLAAYLLLCMILLWQSLED